LAVDRRQRMAGVPRAGQPHEKGRRWVEISDGFYLRQ
jgi:hypothetical protein